MEQDSCPSRPCGCQLKVPYMMTQGDKYLEYIIHIIFKTAPVKLLLCAEIDEKL